MIFAASSSSFALHFLSECALKDKLPSSFYSVATKALPKFTIVIDGAVAIKCFGVATSYLIVIGDVMRVYLGRNTWYRFCKCSITNC